MTKLIGIADGYEAVSAQIPDGVTDLKDPMHVAILWCLGVTSAQHEGRRIAVSATHDARTVDFTSAATNLATAALEPELTRSDSPQVCYARVVQAGPTGHDSYWLTLRRTALYDWRVWNLAADKPDPQSVLESGAISIL